VIVSDIRAGVRNWSSDKEGMTRAVLYGLVSID